MSANKKIFIVTSGFWLLAIVLSSCSSRNEEKANTEEKGSTQKTFTVDASTNGLVGVIEKNPPVQSGDYIVKYPNGIVQMKGYYIGGKREGQWTSFFENGNVQSEKFFKKGLRDGKANVYYGSGKLYYEGYYKDGKEVGDWIFYDEKGNKIKEKNYDKPNS